MTDRFALTVAEYKRRRGGPKFRVEDFCFKEQLDFIRDTAQYKTAVCSRRAGKTIACAADLIDTALTNPDIVCLYVTLRRNNAMKLVWPELKKINTAFELGGNPNETHLSLTFPNGSVIYCSGAKDKNEIENFRGLPLKKVYVDECQSFRAYIEDLIDDVLSKALFDYAGTLCLIGTPGLVPAGYFYDQTKSKAYHHHFWTMFQNPHLERKSGKTVQALVDADCERMGVTISHPKIQRDALGDGLWIWTPLYSSTRQRRTTIRPANAEGQVVLYHWSGRRL
jgi:phage terminase large subunit